MNQVDRSRNIAVFAGPHSAQPSLAAKAAVAIVAILIGSTVLGGLLGKFPMHSEDAGFVLSDPAPRG